MQPQAAMAGSSQSLPQTSIGAEHLPLFLLKSESVPPAPNLSDCGSTIDWLPDFAGYSWIAYGASSLVVISQFSSLSSHQETLISPSFRQSFDLCSAEVSAVSWSLAPGASLTGDLAAAAGNRIFLFEYNPCQGSFCWSQSALLVQSAEVESIKWTGSGDGIVAGGMDVVLWKRGSVSWEIAWKFEMKQLQSLVSTTWLIEGLIATGSYACKLHNVESSLEFSDERYSVNVFDSDGKSRYCVELWHPQPVLMIQWRPSRAGDLMKNVVNRRRNILITSCLDGTVRFWGETGDGRNHNHKNSRDVSESRFSRRSFYVVSVIEINQKLNGSLGTDIFVNWALELGGMVHTGEGFKFYSGQQSEEDMIGRCEWLVALGPGMMLTFWAVHCLDDIAPMRCPRLSLWKREQLPAPIVKLASDLNPIKLIEKSVFFRVSILRERLSSPPTVCSIVHLLPSNTLGCLTLFSGKSDNRGDQFLNKSEKTSCLSSDDWRILSIDGHTCNTLRVAVHPCHSKVDLAVSLDSNGLLLLWALSLNSNSIAGLPSLSSFWKPVGNVSLQDMATKSKSITWAPSWLNSESVLLIGHAQGIDCCLVKTGIEGSKILFHKLCTIPFSDGAHVDGPDKLFAIPLLPTCKATFNYNSFMLIGIWSMGFQAFSWKITLHSYDPTGTCFNCDSGVTDNPGCRCVYESNFAGKRYSIIVNPCSNFLPDCNLNNHVTSFDVVCPSIMRPSLQKHLTNDSSPNYIIYNMVTGHADGTIRLWRSKLSEVSAVNAPWELVGEFIAHKGAVTSISVADFGQKIATSSSVKNANSEHRLALWMPVNLAGVGCFLLEDEIILREHSTAFSWFPIDNGKLILGVCFEKELHVYAERRHSGSSLLSLEKSSDSSIWFCISIARSSSAISEFFWGPCATLILIHDKFFSLYGPYTILMNGNNLSKSQATKDDTLCSNGEIDKGIISLVHTDSRLHAVQDFSSDAVDSKTQLTECSQISNHLFAQIAQEKYDLQTKIGFLSVMEVAENLCEPLPFYHPEVLLMNIHSGNWKRACATMCHVVESVASSSPIEQKSESAHSPSIISQVKLSNYFEGVSSTSGTNKGFQWSGDGSFATTSSHLDGGFINASKDSLFSSASSKFNDFLQILDKSHYLLAITETERMQTFAIVDLVNEISNLQSASVYGGLDDPGRRFWCSVRLQQLICLRRLGRMPSTTDINVTSRLIAWAFHSDCQDNLFNAVLPTEPSWGEMQSMGFGYWFTNAVQLRTKMEKLARSKYLKNKDPKACALLYIALNRLQVLAGLFKISKDEKDKAMVAFLSRNFQEEKHKAAALKNAYVLMGKHQLELAIAFFLLGGDTMSAVNVCAKTLGDEQLALVICRLIEGQGGALERHLISKFILPSAIEKGDYWLSSVLEWSLGNYCQAILSVLGFEKDASVGWTSNKLKHIALLDPSIGQFCQKVVAKNVVRNAVGEKNMTLLSQWATVVAATALNKCGQPLEALECLSSSISNPVVVTQETYGESSEFLPSLLRPTSNSSNWVSCQVVLDLEIRIKSDLAMQYISKLLWEHSSCSNMKGTSNEGSTLSQKSEVHHYKNSLNELQPKLTSTLAYLEQKFALIPTHLLDKIFYSLSNHGLLLVGYHIINGLCFQDYLHSSDHCTSFQIPPSLLKELHVATRDLAQIVTQFIAACCVASSQSNIVKYMNQSPIRQSWGQFAGLWFYMQGLSLSLNRLKASLSLIGNDNAEELTSLAFCILDLCQYCTCLAFSVQQRDCQALALLLQPMMVSQTDELFSPLDMASVKESLIQVSKHMDLQILASRFEDLRGSKLLFHGLSRNTTSAIPGDAWETAGACVWQHVSHFMIDVLNHLCQKLGTPSTLCDHADKKPFLSSSHQLDDSSILEHIQQVSLTLADSIRNIVTLSSFYYTKQLAFIQWKKVEDGILLPTQSWVDDFSQSHRSDSHVQTNKSVPDLGIEKSEVPLSRVELFLKSCAEPAMASQLIAKSEIDLSHLTQHKPSRRWRNLHVRASQKEEAETSQLTQEVVQNNVSGGNETKSDFVCKPHFGQNIQGLDTREGNTALNPISFKTPREIYRKNGELLEALCINSIDQQKAALAIDRKGIIFFNWDDGLPLCDRSEYVWSEADWPQRGWAGTESTPVPTYVSQGVGLGSKKGAHLGLGGATVGVGSITKPRSDLTGGGAFGIPGYAGIGASGLGWEIQEDFEKFIDPPATVENVSTQALFAHPSRDFFLVGSRNTHIYLWKFGEDKATATYGVLPAANVPPPYSLASVTALQFDRCGQRFTNAASDGTVCIWQLEVGGRSNVRPTESSICFSGHASDISYVSTSGSIIAAAGYSSNGVNVVVWDTLAPPATSRASVMCHEGGASSIAVFDNDVGSGSISPLIVTGGKGGDIGLHDFRYIATGKTKRHRHPNIVEQMSGTESKPYSNMGDHNRNGMLWYIPNAHSGSIAKISTIPNTSLFLSGSKDGDVKLWDAKKAKMVYHWPKLHEKHTFLQRSSSGFGSVTRVGLTDIQVVSGGFISCGGDGLVKFTQLGDFA